MSTSNTITKTDLENILNSVLPNVATDFIIEEGTSGIWTYRKWNSGKIEAWGYYADANGVTGSKWISAFDYLYYYDKSISFPSGLFTSVPQVYASSSSSQWVAYSTFSVTTTEFTVRVTKPSSTSQPLSVNFYAIKQ